LYGNLQAPYKDNENTAIDLCTGKDLCPTGETKGLLSNHTQQARRFAAAEQ
jgi:hypothetical protein